MSLSDGLGGADSAPDQNGALLESAEQEPVGILPRDFVIIGPEDRLDTDYRIGRFHLDSGEITAVISVAVTDNKLLVAVPEAVWSRLVAKRLLPQRALTKPILCSVAACHSEQRDEVIEDDSLDCKLWFGFASKDFEQRLDFISDETLDYDFSPSSLEPLLPFARGLLEVSQTHFGFFTAESEAVPECPAPFPGGQEKRIQQLENSLEKIQSSLNLLVGQTTLHGEGVGHGAPRRGALRKPQEPGGQLPQPALRKERVQIDGTPTVPGLDREAVASALAAGIPLKHLEEMGAVLGKRPRRLEEMPRRKDASLQERGPLSDSEEEEVAEAEAELIADESGKPGGGEKDIQKAIVQLTAIASRLATPKEPKNKLETLLDGSGVASHGEASSSSSSSRKNSVAMRALQKTLLDDPKYIYQTIEANLQSDFLARPIAPGEPLATGATVRGWLASRSRVQLYHNHVRWCWQLGGIWDALIANRPEEARARCALLMGAAEQASIDGGNWILSNVALLEAPPPYQAFATHQMPTSLELQHSSLYDPRWAEIFLGHLKEVDSFVDAKKKLSSGAKGAKDQPDPSQPGPKPKAKSKGKGDREKGKRGGDSQPPDGGSNAA